MSDKKIYTLELNRVNVPQPVESKYNTTDTYVRFGLDNLYPEYLVELYNNSTIHSGIINYKTNYVIGGGLKYEDGSEVTDIFINDEYGWEQFVSRTVRDFLISNYLGVKVVYDIFTIPRQYYHVPFHTIRTNTNKDRFWLNQWSITKSNPLQLSRFKINNNDVDTKLFYYDSYVPSLKVVYPEVEYQGCIVDISTEIAIKYFNNKNIKNHFSVGKLITFYQGSNLPNDIKQQIVDDLKDSYMGEHGDPIMVDFQEKDGQAAEVQNIAPGEWDKQYVVTNDRVERNILMQHGCTNPMLFGFKTEGQLGGATELETAYEIYKGSYVVNKRSELEEAFNRLFTGVAKKKLKFFDEPLFSSKLNESERSSVLTVNELRKIDGRQPIEGGDVPLSVFLKSNSQPQQVQVVPSQDKPVVETSVDEKKKLRKLTADDYETVKHIGTSKGEFLVMEELEDDFDEVILRTRFDTQEDIAKYLIDNDIKNLTPAEVVDLINKKLGTEINVKQLGDYINKLKDAGVISYETEDGKITVKPLPKPDVPKSRKVEVVYDYRKKTDIPGDTLIPTSRDFCIKIVEADRYYSRADIQDMSALFGYDVFLYSGGAYHNPETDVTTKSCRHYWKAVSAVRK